jgi:ferric-dicitrate binding protein FerR (iron transport regulator)
LNKQEFLELLHKYLEGKATSEETEMLMNYYDSFQQSDEWNVELGNPEETQARMLARLQQAIAENQKDANTENTLQPITENPLQPFVEKESTPVIRLLKKQWPKIAVAAAIIVVAGAFFLYPKNKDTPVVAAANPVQTPIIKKTVTARVTLTLASGKKIILDTATNGTLALENNTRIIKTDSTLTYESTGNAQTNDALAMNTISVANGSQYRIVLADKSSVWLNTASTLKFPSVFGKKARNVTLSGEAYFEIAKNRKKPFRVNVAPGENDSHGALVEVLGTHFNISAYDDEEVMQTTLLEGSVRITPVSGTKKNGEAKTLVPGEQALIGKKTAAAKQISVRHANMKEVMAWRSGLFDFNDADIPTIMREIARWYHVQVVYEGTIPKKMFTGTMNRNISLENVLEILEQSNIHTQKKQDTIIVTY